MTENLAACVIFYTMFPLVCGCSFHLLIHTSKVGFVVLVCLLLPGFRSLLSYLDDWMSKIDCESVHNCMLVDNGWILPYFHCLEKYCARRIRMCTWVL